MFVAQWQQWRHFQSLILSKKENLTALLTTLWFKDSHFTYHEVIAEFVDPDGESIRRPRLCRPITVNVRRDATQLTVPVHHLDTLKQYNIN